MTEPKTASTTMSEPVHQSSGRLMLYWAMVLIPLAYGIYNTLVDSMPLFTG